MRGLRGWVVSAMRMGADYCGVGDGVTVFCLLVMKRVIRGAESVNRCKGR